MRGYNVGSYGLGSYSVGSYGKPITTGWVFGTHTTVLSGGYNVRGYNVRGYSLGGYSVRGYGMPMTTGWVARDTLTRPCGGLQCERPQYVRLHFGRLQCESLRDANDNELGCSEHTHPSFREATM